MSISLGKVELIGVQDIFTEESRGLVEQKVPGQTGSVFQDLGREPTVVVMEGLMFGTEVLGDLEHLRSAQLKTKPLLFNSDIAVGTELTDVLIDDLKVRQIAGYENRYRFYIRIREYVEPPESQAKSDAPVNEAVASDAAAWEQDSLDASEALQNPNTIPETLASNPNALMQMSSDDLSGAITDNLKTISPDSFGGILKSVGELDLSKLGGVLESIREKGILGTLMEKFSDLGKSLEDMLGGIDLLGIVKDIVTLFTAGVKLIKILKDMFEETKNVGKHLSSFDIGGSVEAIVSKGVEGLKKLVASVGNLVKSTTELITLLVDTAKELDIKELKCGDMLKSLADKVNTGLDVIINGLQWIGAQLVQLAAISVLLGLSPSLFVGCTALVSTAAAYIDGIGGSPIIGDAQESINGVINQVKSSLEDLLSIGEALFENDLEDEVFKLGDSFTGLKEKIDSSVNSITGTS